MCRLHLKCVGTRAEIRFRLSAKLTSPFKSAGASVQSTTGSRGSVKSTGYSLHSAVSPSLPLPCVTVCHHISTGLYYLLLFHGNDGYASASLTLYVRCIRFHSTCCSLYRVPESTGQPSSAGTYRDRYRVHTVQLLCCLISTRVLFPTTPHRLIVTGTDSLLECGFVGNVFDRFGLSLPDYGWFK